MGDERMRVLQMIEQGKVTPDEGARLLQAIRKREEQRAQPAGTARGRCLKVTIYEGDQTQPKVNVTVPLALGRLALKFIPKSALESMQEQGITVKDIEEMLESIEKAGPMHLVDVQDGDKKIQVGIE